MEAMRESWTDDRMDDLNAKVDRVDADLRGLRMEMKTEFVAVRGEMDRRFDKVDERFDKVDERFDKVDERFDKVDERFDKVDERFDKVDLRFERMNERFDRVEERFERLDRLMIRFYAGFSLVLIAALVGLIANQP